MSKKAILAVSFGTSHWDTLEKNIAAIERDLAAAYPDWEVRRAFTSGMILRKLRQRDGVEIDDTAQALARLHREGFDTVVVQPTHVMNGEEYDKLAEQAAPWEERFARFVVGRPLLTGAEDYAALASAVADSLPPIREDEAVVLMGHGTEHFANAAYAALEDVFHDLGRKEVFVGTVEGYPPLEQVMRRMADRKYRSRALLAPLMVVAGDHAKNDMAGEEEDSWESQLRAAGYETRCVLRGLGEVPAVRAMFVEHAGRAMDELG